MTSPEPTPTRTPHRRALVFAALAAAAALVALDGTAPAAQPDTVTTGLHLDDGRPGSPAVMVVTSRGQTTGYALDGTPVEIVGPLTPVASSTP